MQSALGLAALVTLEAAGLEDGEDLRVEFDPAFFHRLHLTLVGDDLFGEEMVDRIVRWETGSQRGDGSLRGTGEPLLRGFAALLPILALAGAGGGAGGGIDAREALFFLRGVGGPAGVIVGRGFSGRRKQLPIRAAGEGDRGDGFAEFGAAAGTLVVDHVADDGLEDDAMFAALGLEFSPGITVAGRGEPEIAAEVEVVVLRLDRLIVGAGGREGRLGDELAVDEEGGGAAAAEEEAVLAGGELHDAEGAEEVGMAAFDAHAGVDVFLRHAGEAEGRGDVAVGHGEGLVGPDVGGRLPGLTEFDANLAVRDGGPIDLRRRAGDFRCLGGLRTAGAVVTRVGARSDQRDFGLHDRGQGGGEASGDFRRRDERTIETDLIDRAAEAAVGEAAHRRTDPHGCVVDDRGVGRRTVHVPRALHLLAVDPAADALRLTEFVADCDVVPAAVVGEARRSRPAMPLHAFLRRRSEEEVEAGGVVEHAQAHGPVLIARVGRLRVRAALADDRGVLALAQSVQADPGLDREGIAVLEIEDAVRTGVLDHQARTLAVESRRDVLGVEAGIIRTTRTGLLEADIADGGEVRARLAVEGPSRDRLGGGEGGEAKEKGQKTAHLKEGTGEGRRGFRPMSRMSRIRVIGQPSGSILLGPVSCPIPLGIA